MISSNVENVEIFFLTFTEIVIFITKNPDSQNMPESKNPVY